jgi:hypothetical protein
MSAPELLALADWLKYTQGINQNLAHIPEMAQHISNLAVWEKAIRAVAQPVSQPCGEPPVSARLVIYEAALERISASRIADFGTLHPEGCASEAKEALYRARALATIPDNLSPHRNALGDPS